MKEPIIIVGSGAVATLFAARLAFAGFQVKMLAGWQEAIEKIRQKGVKVIDKRGSEITGRVQVSSDPMALGSAKNALVLVKSWQTGRAAEQLSKMLSVDGIALSLQNGLGNHEALAAVLGEDRVSSGVIVLGAQIAEPGVTRTSGRPLVQLDNHPRLGYLEKSLKEAGFQIEKYDDILPLQWEKLVVNSAINPISAILNVCNGELLHNRYACELMQKLVSEAEEICETAGVALRESPMDRIRKVIGRTKENRSSMQQDRQRGSVTEIDAINGSLLYHARALGVDAPYQLCVLTMIKALTEAGQSASLHSKENNAS